MEKQEGAAESLGTAQIPPLEGEHIPASQPDFDGVHPDAAGAQPGQPGGMETGELVSGLLLVVHGLIAKRFGPHWELSQPEAQELGSAAGAVIDKYWPGFSVGPEARLVAAGAAVYGIRYVAHKAWQAEQEAKKKAQQAQAGEGGEG